MLFGVLRDDLADDSDQELTTAVAFPTEEELEEQCGRYVKKYAEAIRFLEVHMGDREVAATTHCAKESARLSEAARKLREEEEEEEDEIAWGGSRQVDR